MNVEQRRRRFTPTKVYLRAVALGEERFLNGDVEGAQSWLRGVWRVASTKGANYRCKGLVRRWLALVVRLAEQRDEQRVLVQP